MIRNFKVLGLALAATLALSAIGVSSASAQDRFTLDGGAETAVVTGTSHDNQFRITDPTGESVAQFRCTTSLFTATVANGATEVTATASYTGQLNKTPHTSHECDSNIGSVTVDMNSCAYILTGDTSKKHGSGDSDARVSIECNEGDEIDITNENCEVTVPAQTPTLGGVTYTNESNGGKWDVKVTATATGITFTSHGPFCGLAGIPPEGNIADYEGTATVKALEDIECNTHNLQVGITAS